MCLNKISVCKKKISYWGACHFWGYCPTPKEVKNSKVKELAERLEVESKSKTLTNLLEWQDGNVTFWDERHPISTALFPITLIVTIIATYFTIFQVYFNHNLFPFIGDIFSDLWLKGIIASFGTLIGVIVWVIWSNRKIPVIDGFKNVFKPSISLSMLLRRDRKLGVCKDYAKLTACLLSNTTNCSEIYFLHAAGHVATGARINEDIYMLDQHLPLLTINQWCMREHGTTSASKISVLFRKTHRFKDNQLETVNINLLLKKDDKPKFNTIEEFKTEIAKFFTFTKDNFTNGTISKIELPKWSKGLDLYRMSDDIVIYSIVRWLKKRISNNLIDLDQIIDIKIEEEGRDLIFQVSFKSRKPTPSSQAWKAEQSEQSQTRRIKSPPQAKTPNLFFLFFLFYPN
jgi:predicted transglutaminase-like protease